MQLLYLTSHRLHLTPHGHGAEPFDDVWDVARSGHVLTPDAPVLTIRPVSMAELDQVYVHEGTRAQTIALAQTGVVAINGEPADVSQLSYGVLDALATAILAVSRGPLERRRPSTPAVDASAGQS